MARLLIISFLLLIGCSEPFSFETDEVMIDVIDAKVSTLEGRSFVRIYSDYGVNGTEELNDLDVRIENESGDEFLFNYTNDSLHYQPVSTDFKGEEGLSYKLTVYRQDQLIYESAYDAIASPIDFKLTAGDTSVVKINSGILFNESGTAFYASIAPSASNYAKFEFRYFYEDYFTEDTVEVNDLEEYTLFSCTNNLCPDSTRVPVGLTLMDEWFFILRGCVPPPEITNIIEQCTDSGNSCCEYREDWPVLIEVISESISPEAYDYWSKVKRLGQNDGLVFDTYPFPLKGNIDCITCKNEVVGLFRAVAETSKKTEFTL